MPASDVRVAATESDRAAAFRVRHAVFVEEQGVDESLEYDGKDDDAVHFLASEEGTAIGAARLRELDDETGKVERVAVREAHRGNGWGRDLVTAVEAEARRRGLSTLVLHAQTAVESFYHRLGYRTVSEEFEEAGIAHVEMTKRLS
ncbi:GNAT family N-acetyltransferase [Halorientalis brevis]|uniref:GNAT family N-acetyltransferase n=1 Tax=Halorientalis brevis TaxID=1126241 RepID=A0ABD6CBF1_9EURY|nr:GNAT family N-acetyltransferase [Halorientalis brevis]